MFKFSMSHLYSHLLFFPCPYSKSVILSFLLTMIVLILDLLRISKNDETFSVCFMFKFVLSDIVLLLLIFLSALIIRLLDGTD